MPNVSITRIAIATLASASLVGGVAVASDKNGHRISPRHVIAAPTVATAVAGEQAFPQQQPVLGKSIVDTTAVKSCPTVRGPQHHTARHVCRALAETESLALFR